MGVRETADRWTDLHLVNTPLQRIETVGLKLMETVRGNGLNRRQDTEWNKTKQRNPQTNRKRNETVKTQARPTA